jgi:hypothetical protein
MAGVTRVGSVDIQFGPQWDQAKANQLVQSLQQTIQKVNNNATQLATLANAAPSTTVPPHVLATTGGNGGVHTVSGLTAGQVLVASSPTTVQFRALNLQDLGQTDGPSIAAAVQGDVLTFIDGFWSASASNPLNLVNPGSFALVEWNPTLKAYAWARPDSSLILKAGSIAVNDAAINHALLQGLQFTVASGGTAVANDHPQYALLAAANTWAQPQTMPGLVSTSDINVTGNLEQVNFAPEWRIQNTDDIANEGIWRVHLEPGLFAIAAVSDDGSDGENWLTATRIAEIVDQVNVQSNALTWNGVQVLTTDYVPPSIVNPTFTSAITVPNSISLSGIAPYFQITDTDTPTIDEASWAMYAEAGQLRFTSVDDSGSWGENWLTVMRSAERAQAINLSADLLTFNGDTVLTTANVVQGTNIYLTTDALGRLAINATTAASGGTVTSVGLSTPGTGIALGGTNPVTSSGTITVDLSSSAYTALADALTALQPITGLSGSYTLASLTVNAAGQITAVSSGSVSVPTGANPTASVGLSAVNGSASTFMRSDGAPALSQSISPTMSGQWKFTGTVVRSSAAISTSLGSDGANPSIVLNNTGAGTDANIWEIISSGAALSFCTVNDAVTSLNPFLTVARSGNADGGLFLAGATGGAQGQGTFNAKGLFVNGGAVAVGTIPTVANPSASIGLAAVNGSSGHWMDAGSAPPLSQAISPVWSGNHQFNAPIIVGANIVGTSTGFAYTISAAPSASLGSSGLIQLFGSTSGTPYQVVLASNAASITLLPSGASLGGTTSTALNINAPSGNAPNLAMTGAGTSQMIVMQGAAGNGASINMVDGHTGNRSWGVRAGSNAAGVFDIADFNAGASRFTIGTTGSITVPASATAGTQMLTVSGTASAYSIVAVGSSGSGTSFGLLVLAGTTSADAAFTVLNQAASLNFLTVNGVGATTISSGSASAVALTVNGSAASTNVLVVNIGTAAVTEAAILVTGAPTTGSVVTETIITSNTTSSTAIVDVSDGTNFGFMELQTSNVTPALETGGVTGSAVNMGSSSNIPLQICTNDTVRILIAGTGAVTIKGPTLSYQATVSTGTSVPTIGTNKPGSATTLTPVTWETVVINGTTFFRPLWQ